MTHLATPPFRRVRLTSGLPAIAGLCASLCVPVAYAQNASPPEQTGMPGNPAVAPAEKPYVPPANFGEWASGIKFGLQVQGGYTVNPNAPDSHRNFGQLFNDSSNRPILNQVLGTISRDVDPKATSVDIGFKLQLMYGSDSRITHMLGVFDQLIHDRNQLDVGEASITARIPQLFANGLDLKAGIYPTPMGVELIDPKTNAFYSHSYIFNYGLPFKHTGVLATAHVSDLLDLYLGVDTGTNTFIAYGAGDNNNRPGGTAGFGLNFDGGKLTVLALTHIGPEDSKRLVPFANSALRYFNDVAVVWKTTEKLTLTAEANYVREDGYRAEGYGIAGYAGYTLTDNLTLNGRAEVWRDNNNFFVTNPVAERDYVAAQRGTFSRFITAAKPTTYSEFTLGVTYKIPGLPEKLSTAMIRPEVRYDRALNNSQPFGNGDRRGAVTLAADFVLGF
ncbi:MAG: porin [Acetobacteraceae bacterium]